MCHLVVVAARHRRAASTAVGGATATLLEARSGSSVTGTARATPSSGGVALHVEIQGAAPGEHGVHIHEKGDCSDPKATSAGGHYNPAAGAHHGGLNTPVRHGGDLGNMNVDSSGKGSLDVDVPGLSVSEVVGKAVVVHEKQDDLQTQSRRQLRRPRRLRRPPGGLEFWGHARISR